ncbi:dihydropyrimidinase [Allorhizobium pseudoryzae]|uniref:dihydropyrimidinase n=1 Tax=Allorhizobium pseudoryzae TaxID=379684 RepID=UPI003D08B5B1
MTAFDTIIKGGTIVTAADRYRADIGISGGRITAIAAELSSAGTVIDAGGLLVLPGGIDSHVHLSQPSSDSSVMADDFQSGTRAAAAGGTTTVLPFALQKKGQSLREAVAAYHAEADGKCHVDVSFHLIISDPTPQVLGQELPALIEAGYRSFKVFMTYDDLVLNDRQLLEVFAVAGLHGATVMVHAEGYDAIRFLSEKLEREGHVAPYYHAISRPEIVEREATHRAISHAEITGIPIVIVHVSGREALEQIRWARARGLKVTAETCPQYITLTAEDLHDLNMDFNGAKYVCSPPPRDAASQAAIWQGLTDGTLELFSSDHCPFFFQDAQGRGKDTPKARTSFRWVPNGIPGVETRLPILFSEGVSKGRISLETFVALTATNHAKTYGLYPRKGTIAIGSDADLVLWDATRQETIRQANLHHGSDYTPWEGFEVTGWPVVTILRGEVVMKDGQILNRPGAGAYISRSRSID